MLFYLFRGFSDYIFMYVRRLMSYTQMEDYNKALKTLIVCMYDAFLLLGLLVPSITWRVQSLMVSVEARGLVVDQVRVFEKRVSSMLNSKRIR